VTRIPPTSSVIRLHITASITQAAVPSSADNNPKTEKLEKSALPSKEEDSRPNDSKKFSTFSIVPVEVATLHNSVTAISAITNSTRCNTRPTLKMLKTSMSRITRTHVVARCWLKTSHGCIRNTI